MLIFEILINRKSNSPRTICLLSVVCHKFTCSAQIEFILGREIEIGGDYKGVVTSIKEYGAFVEFNGGQQGLLHISELSHEPVCTNSFLF